MSKVVASFIYLAYQAIRAAWGNGELWAHVEHLVQQAETAAASGQRLVWVNDMLDAYDDLPPPVRAGLATTATWLLNLGIEAMVARLNTK